jgi:hypothetical protein
VKYKWHLSRGVSFVDDIGLLKLRDDHRAVVECLATAPVLLEAAADFMEWRLFGNISYQNHYGEGAAGEWWQVTHKHYSLPARIT